MSAAHFFTMGASGPVAMDDNDVGDLSLRLARFGGGLKSRVDAKGWTETNLVQASTERTRRYLDSLNLNIGGGISPEALTHRLSRITEEALPPLSADRLFVVNSEPKPGTRSFRQERILSTGEVTIIGGAGSGVVTDIPEVQVGAASFEGPIIYYAISFSIDFLAALSDNILDISTQEMKMNAGRQIMAAKRNRWAFFGQQELNLYGAINHPYIPQAVSLVPYNGDSAVADILDDFNYWAQYAARVSNATYEPDSVVLSVDTYTYLASTRVSTTDKTKLLEELKAANPHIKHWERAQELDNAFGTSVHGILFYRKGNGGRFDHSIALIESMQPTLLAPDVRGLGTKWYLVGGFGGAHHVGSGHNLVVRITGRT